MLLVSSRLNEDGSVTITTPYSWASPGHRLYPAPGWNQAPAERRSSAASFTDYLARLALSRAGRPWGEGVGIKPSDGALSEQIANGCIHESLAAEPNGNRNGRVAGVDDAAPGTARPCRLGLLPCRGRDQKRVQVPHPCEVKPLSVGLIVTIVRVLALLFAMIALNDPVNERSRAQ